MNHPLQDIEPSRVLRRQPLWCAALIGTLFGSLLVFGCGGQGKPSGDSGTTSANPAAQPDGATAGTRSAASPAARASKSEADDEPQHPPKRTLKPVELGAFSGTPRSGANSNPSGPPANGTAADDETDPTDAIIAALRPLQVLLGEWRGLTARTFDGFKAIDQPSWVWDLTTDPAQPALVMTSEDSPYFRHLRLTYFPQEKVYFLSMRDPEGNVRTFRGTFTQPPRDVPGDDRKPQRTFKLQLSEVGEGPRGERWQLVFNQQENNRCLIEISRARGSGTFRRMDTVALQRQGTSFALSDTDYGEKTCVISQGLGTIAVSYKGRTYWVCCTGCKAAFEEDPERWIARFERIKQKQQQ